MQKWGLLAAVVLVIIVVGMAIGIGFPPGEWYAALQNLGLPRLTLPLAPCGRYFISSLPLQAGAHG